MGLVWRKDDLLTLSEKQLSMANETCQQKIYAGIDVELSGGTEHFSLETHDQANIESMFTAVTLGAKEQQYHCDVGRSRPILPPMWSCCTRLTRTTSRSTRPTATS